MSAVEPAEYARRFHQMVSTTRLQPQALAPRPSFPTLILEPRPHPYPFPYPYPYALTQARHAERRGAWAARKAAYDAALAAWRAAP